jgi:hypothetical protein
MCGILPHPVSCNTSLYADREAQSLLLRPLRGGAASGPFDAMSMWELGAQTESANVLPARGKSSKRTDAECIREPR